MAADVVVVVKIEELAGGIDSFGWGTKFVAKVPIGVCG